MSKQSADVTIPTIPVVGTRNRDLGATSYHAIVKDGF